MIDDDRILLEQQAILANERLLTLREEYRVSRVAYDYMNLLIRTLKANVGLQEEWRGFLAIAGLAEPEWKSEYTTETIELSDEY